MFNIYLKISKTKKFGEKKPNRIEVVECGRKQNPKTKKK